MSGEKLPFPERCFYHPPGSPDGRAIGSKNEAGEENRNRYTALMKDHHLAQKTPPTVDKHFVILIAQQSK
jgi:hypothetical protein